MWRICWIIILVACSQQATPEPIQESVEELVKPFVGSGACEPFSDLFTDTENKSRLLAQCHQESGGRPTVKSPFAEGLMQFTPKTAEWAESSFCRHLGKARLDNPWWSANCGAAYMAWLKQRTPTDNTYCATTKNAERAYNGGLGWINRESKLTTDHSYSGLSSVCSETGRAGWACDENLKYADYISKHQKKYGHHGGVYCN